MQKVLAINGSPTREKGSTARLLEAFMRGMSEAGAETETVHSAGLAIKPCAGELHCWYRKPGECHIKDDMQGLYPKIREADTLVLAVPVYVPLTGEAQNLLNRICPLMEPVLVEREGRTRARFHDGVRVSCIVLVSTGGWWEMGNFDVLVHITKELAANTSVEFGGALLRPHASAMMNSGKITDEGEKVLSDAAKAGHELMETGAMSVETLEAVGRPLLSFEEMIKHYNDYYGIVKKRAEKKPG